VASDPIARDRLRARFWERGLKGLTPREWEALCDGCGKCCLNKLEDDETGEVVFTDVACRLLDDATCRCAHYETRLQFVPNCVVLTPKTLPDVAYFMPSTCAYRLLYEGKPLPAWHPLLTGDPESPHKAGASLRGQTYSEMDVPEEEWEDHLIQEPTGETP
jgi:uncharacterized cysteine cluster protein YcgN (CxxCxxCC family)